MMQSQQRADGPLGTHKVRGVAVSLADVNTTDLAEQPTEDADRERARLACDPNGEAEAQAWREIAREVISLVLLGQRDGLEDAPDHEE